MPKLVKFTKPEKPSQKKNAKSDGVVIEEGKLGKLLYKVYKRRVIHIYNSTETLLFKKDCDIFDDIIKELKINELNEGGCKKIEGSGDNDTLVFTCKDGDIDITLEKREYGMLAKLKKILKK